jgi:hypothetical protein
VRPRCPMELRTVVQPLGFWFISGACERAQPGDDRLYEKCEYTTFANARPLKIVPENLTPPPHHDQVAMETSKNKRAIVRLHSYDRRYGLNKSAATVDPALGLRD